MMIVVVFACCGYDEDNINVLHTVLVAPYFVTFVPDVREPRETFLCQLMLWDHMLLPWDSFPDLAAWNQRLYQKVLTE